MRLAGPVTEARGTTIIATCRRCPSADLAAIWLIRVRLGRSLLETLAAGVSTLCLTGLTVGTMAAFDLSGVGGDNWAAYHALMIAAVAMAWVALAAECGWRAAAG